jgi:hypothetical protein
VAADKLAGAYVNCSNNQGNVYYIVIGSVKVLLSGGTCRQLAHFVVKGGPVLRRRQKLEMCCFISALELASCLFNYP